LSKEFDADPAFGPSDPSHASLSRPDGINPGESIEFENDTQRGYAAFAAGEPFDRFQTHEWVDGWSTASDFAWWKQLAAALGGQVHGFSYRHSGTIIIGGEYHSLSGLMLSKVAAIAMEREAPRPQGVGPSGLPSAGLQASPDSGPDHNKGEVLP
jgi:hypothetical protein